MVHKTQTNLIFKKRSSYTTGISSVIFDAFFEVTTVYRGWNPGRVQLNFRSRFECNFDSTANRDHQTDYQQRATQMSV